MPEEEEEDGNKKEGKDKKAGKGDEKGGKDDKKGCKDDKKAKEKTPKSPMSPSKVSDKGSPKASRKADASKDKAEKPEKGEEHKPKTIERVVVKKPMGPYKAPPPSHTMIKAMAEKGPVYAEHFYNDAYEDEQEGRNYVEMQMYERRSGTNINEGAAAAPGGVQTFYVNIPPRRPPRSPALDEYHDDRHRSRRDRLARPSVSQEQMMYFDDGGNVSLRQEASFYDYQDVPPAVAVPRQEHRRPIVLPPTTVVVNLTEGGPPTAGVGGSSALVDSRPSGYDMPLRQQNRRASMRFDDELRTPYRRQQPDLPARNPPYMTAELLQQLRDIAKQNHRPMEENVVASTERVIYEVVRKVESSEPYEPSDEQVERYERVQRPSIRPRGSISGAMSPLTAPRQMSPPGTMSPGTRAPPAAMLRSPISVGSRGYPQRRPSIPMRMASPRMSVQYSPQGRRASSVRSSSFSQSGSRKPDDGMTLFPERSLIMLLVFLFLFVLVVVILAISGLNIPGFGKNKSSSS